MILIVLPSTSPWPGWSELLIFSSSFSDLSVSATSSSSSTLALRSFVRMKNESYKKSQLLPWSWHSLGPNCTEQLQTLCLHSWMVDQHHCSRRILNKYLMKKWKLNITSSILVFSLQDLSKSRLITSSTWPLPGRTASLF